MKDDDVKKVLNEPLPGGSGGDSAAHASSPAPSTLPKFETDSYRVTAEALQHRGTALSITLVFENLSDENFLLCWNSDQTYLLDADGEKWQLGGQGRTMADYNAAIAGALQTGSTSVVTWPHITLLPGTKVKNTLLFSPVGQNNGTQFTLAAIECAPKPGRQVMIRGLK